MFYNAVLVPATQHHESGITIQVSLPLEPSRPSRLSQDCSVFHNVSSFPDLFWLSGLFSPISPPSCLIPGLYGDTFLFASFVVNFPFGVWQLSPLLITSNYIICMQVSH